MTRPPPGHTTTTITEPPLDISSSWDVCHLHRRAPGRRGDRAVRVRPAGRRTTAPRHPIPPAAPGAGLLPAGGAAAALVHRRHPTGPTRGGQLDRPLDRLPLSARGPRRAGRIGA